MFLPSAVMAVLVSFPSGMEAEAKDEVRRIPASSDPRIERLRANVLKSETRR